MRSIMLITRKKLDPTIGKAIVQRLFGLHIKKGQVFQIIHILQPGKWETH